MIEKFIKIDIKHGVPNMIKNDNLVLRILQITFDCIKCRFNSENDFTIFLLKYGLSEHTSAKTIYQYHVQKEFDIIS